MTAGSNGMVRSGVQRPGLAWIGEQGQEGLSRGDLDLIEVFTRIDESPFSTSTTSNWVARLGGLPPYVRGVCRGIMKSGKSFEDALPIAIGIMRTWARGGPTYGHKSHATPATMAKAAMALKQWEALKSAAHAGGSRRSCEVRASVSQSGRPGTGAVTGAYAPGHPFHGNQHTGSITSPHKPHVDHTTQTSQAQLLSSSAPQDATDKADLVNAAAKAKADAAIAEAAIATTQHQQSQNVAYAQARVKAGSTEDQSPMAMANMANTATDASAAVDKAKADAASAMAKFQDARKAASAKRSDLVGASATRDFVGEGNPAGVDDASGASKFLPAGPTAAQDKRIRRKLQEPQQRPSDKKPDTVGARHPFEGPDTKHCEKCNRPVTDPIHEQVDAHASLVPKSYASTNPTANPAGVPQWSGGMTVTRSDLVGKHRFVGGDLWRCETCGFPITASTHSRHDQMVTAAKEAARKPPGQSVPPMPRQLAYTRAEAGHKQKALESNERAIAMVGGPLEAALHAHFAEQRRATVNRLRGKRGLQMMKRAEALYPRLEPSAVAAELHEPGEATPPVSPDDIFDQRHWTDKLTGVLEPHFLTAAALARAEVRRQAAVPEGASDERAAAGVALAMRNRAQLAAQAVTATTAKHIAEAVQQGVVAGERRDEVAGRVEHVFGVAESQRAGQVAQTGAGGAFNQAGLAYARGLPEHSVGSKVWLAHPGQATRPGHRMADGQERQLDEPFVVAGAQMDYPGDTTTPMDDWIGCRCSQAFLPPDQSYGPTARAAQAFVDALA